MTSLLTQLALAAVIYGALTVLIVRHFARPIQKQVKTFMEDVKADLAAVKLDLDTITTGVGSISTRLTAQSAQIADLQAQLAAAGIDPAIAQMAADIKTEADSLASAKAALVPPVVDPNAA